MRERFARLAEVGWRVQAGGLRLWRGLREWCGDAAYERYLKSHARDVRHGALLSREEFYLEQIQKRYSRPSRCC